VSTIDLSSETSIQSPGTGTPDFKLEVVVVPVSDAARAKQFYASLGWREDADFVISHDYRVLQFTPPGSQASIIFGTGVTPAVAEAPAGSLMLAVDDIEAARAELIERGVDVSELFHGVAFDATGQRREPGPDPERQSYGSYATFSDPDGNEWLLQEVTARLPGRVDGETTFTSVTELARALRRAEAAHGEYEKRLGRRDDAWADWYAAYIVREQTGQAAAA
jgi:catechol 2,3-dioxygenase-like lactoylglutathione lyase family enzyme